MLRWKGLQGEEEAYLARLARRSQDPRVRALASEVGDLRSGLAAAARGGEPKAFETALQALEAKQLALGQVSRDYKDHLRVRTANLDELRAALPTEAVLIEFRQFQPVRLPQRDVRRAAGGGAAARRLRRAGAGRCRAAGRGARVRRGAPHRVDRRRGRQGRGGVVPAALRPVREHARRGQGSLPRPDGLLHLVPYSRLKLADGRYLEERYELRILQTGRDLLRSDPDKPVRGLLALGGIDFGATAIAAGKPDSVFLTAASGQDLSGAITRTAESFGSFGPLTASGEEAMQLKECTCGIARTSRPRPGAALPPAKPG
jgi:hypothetical protein